MKKEKSAILVNAIVLATTFISLSTAVVNLWAAALKPTSSSLTETVAAACPAPAAPQVIQYLGFPTPAPAEDKEPPRPTGQ